MRIHDLGRDAPWRVSTTPCASTFPVTSGQVYLVGAGPGDPELITVKGLQCLRRADVIVYDRLVSEDLLDEARPGAELIYAGKAPRQQALTQDEINALLVARARAGKTVVRLKGGDPFVFGRGGEEAEACAAAGVACAVVPGVSSAVGVPAGAGIPVTHRGVSGAFAVVTAHRADAEGAGDVDWGALARVDTLVILMGVERLPHIVARLFAHGRVADTPVAIIESGTLPGQRVTTGTLADIVGRASEAAVQSPATIVVGDVVALRGQIGLDAEAEPAWALTRSAC
ncbi:MAG: uroporphyrinogen-III C-methyltransferase [Anaerolineae bacterium]